MCLTAGTLTKNFQNTIVQVQGLRKITACVTCSLPIGLSNISCAPIGPSILTCLCSAQERHLVAKTAKILLSDLIPKN